MLKIKQKELLILCKVRFSWFSELDWFYFAFAWQHVHLSFYILEMLKSVQHEWLSYYYCKKKRSTIPLLTFATAQMLWLLLSILLTIHQKQLHSHFCPTFIHHKLRQKVINIVFNKSTSLLPKSAGWWIRVGNCCFFIFLLFLLLLLA